MNHELKIPITFLAGTLGSGGAERQLFYILRGLKILGSSPTIISLRKGEYWERYIQELDIPFYFVEEKRSRLEKLSSILAYLKKSSPALIQSQHFYMNLYSSLAGFVLGIKNIGAIRSNGALEVKSNGQLYGMLGLRMPTYLAPNSLAGARFAEKAGVPGYRIKLLPNVVDTDVFKPNPVEKTTQNITLLLVSNLTLPDKRVDLYIEAVARVVKATNYPITALIAGDGILRPELERLGSELGLFPDTIRFLGNFDHIEDLYKCADILVLTSDLEGTPNVILEAMSSGLPVVATNVGGVSDVVQEGQTGFLADPGDAVMIANRIICLVESAHLRNQMGLMGREYVLVKHSVERLPDLLFDFYDTILNEDNHRCQKLM